MSVVEMENELELRRDAQGLALVCGKTIVRGDFTRLLPRLKPHNLNRELVVRAAKLKSSSHRVLDGGAEELPLAIDATAGLGDDSLLLAAAGFRVQLYERNPTTAALLRDTLLRAQNVPELAELASRMTLFETDSTQALPHLPEQPDIVLLDPMFPAGHNRAAAKKKLQFLQQLEEPCADEEALLDAALAAHPRKIIVKRPAKGPYLAQRTPSYSLSGKAIRFDCIVLTR